VLLTVNRFYPRSIRDVEATVLADFIVEAGIPLALEIGKNLAFLIISLPLMLNICHKPIFYVTKNWSWRG